MAAEGYNLRKLVHMKYKKLIIFKVLSCVVPGHDALVAMSNATVMPK